MRYRGIVVGQGEWVDQGPLFDTYGEAKEWLANTLERNNVGRKDKDWGYVAAVSADGSQIEAVDPTKDMSPIGAALFNCFKSSNPMEQIQALNRLAERGAMPTNPA